MIDLANRTAPLRDAFAQREGRMTAWAIMWTWTLVIVGGVAVDSSHVYGYHNRLQSVADASALAAAAKMHDPEAGKLAAVDLATRNMPTNQNGQVIRTSDVTYGRFDEHGAFVAGYSEEEPPSAVRVVAGRDGVRGRAIPTWMLRLSLFAPDEFNINAASFATATIVYGGDDGGDLGPSCTAANIIGTGFIDTGGGNILSPGVCLHGDDGVRTGGNDLIPVGAHISAPDETTITINTLAPGSDTEDNIKYETPTVTPILSAMNEGLFEQYWDAIYYAGIKLYGWGDAKNYHGPALPKWLFREDTGRAFPVRTLPREDSNNYYYTFQEGQIMTNGIYLWKGDIQIAGNVDFSNVAIFATGSIRFGGGSDVTFNNVLLFAKGDIQGSGDTMWGDPDAYCDGGEYNVVMLSEGTTQLGGWGSGQKGLYGALVAAGGGFNPGGSMRNSGGLYVEVDQPWTSLGGNMDLSACGNQLNAFLEAFELDDANVGYEAAGGPDATGFLMINDGEVDLASLIESALN